MAAKLKREEIDDPQLPFWLMTLSYGCHQSNAIIFWCDQTLKQLDKLERPRRHKPGQVKPKQE